MFYTQRQQCEQETTMDGAEPRRRSKRRSGIRNITRFTYDYSGFQGWRLSICRHHFKYTRYFSDREYGGEQAALAAAKSEREIVYARLAEFPFEPKRVLEEFESSKPSGGRLHRRSGSRKGRKRASSEYEC